MAVTTFIPELWSAKLVENLKKTQVALGFVNRNYEGEISSYGDTVHIGTLSDVSVRTYVPGTNITVDSLTTTDQTLIIDQKDYFAFELDDVDRAQIRTDLIASATQSAAYKLGDTVDTYIFGLLAGGAASTNTIGSLASPIKLTATNIYENIVKMAVAMDKANVPKAGRKLAISPDAYGLILQDDRFVKTGGTFAENVLQTGMVARAVGFDIYVTNNLKTETGTGTGTPTCYDIVASHVDFTTYADQIVKTEAMRREGQFKDMVRGLHVYGAKVINGNGIIKLVATF